MKRQRGRGRKPNTGNRSLESNGPDVKIRGTANQIYEKYMQYARDAQTSGDRVKAENYLQHAEHYFRIVAANAPKERPAPQYQEEPSETEEAPANGADALQVVDGEVDAPAGEETPEDVEAASDDVEAPRKPRRPRRRKPAEDAPPADQEARSALDALADEQAAIAEG
ncbi:MAG: DUF4167 domain-containing protein [Pseudomonadota bacterium]